MGSIELFVLVCTILPYMVNEIVLYSRKRTAPDNTEKFTYLHVNPELFSDCNVHI
jgi:hypothetical protein